jgi:hypothetical protein
MQLLGPWPGWIFVVSSLAPEHVIKPDNFGSRSGYPPIRKHWSDSSIEPTFMHWDSSIYFILSLNLGLLMTLTRCCGGLMMCLILLDESTTHVSKAARSSCLYVFFAEKLDSLLDHLDNRHKMHGSQNIAIDCWSRNQNGTRYCSHAMLHVYKYAFRLARMAISHSSFSRLGFPFLALGLLAMEDKRGTKRPRSL